MKRNLSFLLPVAGFILLTASAQAQRPGGPGGPGGFQPPPGMQAKFQAWRTWRDTHKNVTSLERTLGALVAVEQDPHTKLNKPQARAVLAVVRKWQSKPALTDVQAGLVNTQLDSAAEPGPAQQDRRCRPAARRLRRRQAGRLRRQARPPAARLLPVVPAAGRVVSAADGRRLTRLLFRPRVITIR